MGTVCGIASYIVSKGLASHLVLASLLLWLYNHVIVDTDRTSPEIPKCRLITPTAPDAAKEAHT